MVNVGINLTSLLGMGLVLIGLLLPFSPTFFGRSNQPENRLQNLILAGAYIVSGAILLLNGWRLDPILQLSQVLLVGSSVFLLLRNN